MLYNEVIPSRSLDLMGSWDNSSKTLSKDCKQSNALSHVWLYLVV